MQTVKISGGTLRVSAGTMIGLSDAKAKQRKGFVRAADDGLYETLVAQEFKSGETLAISLDDIPKHAAAFVKVQDGTAAPAADIVEAVDADDPDAGFATARRPRRKG